MRATTSARGNLPIPKGGSTWTLPFKDRTARTKLVVITSEVHQMFGRYSGSALADDGKRFG